jgi:hypothetical protein
MLHRYSVTNFQSFRETVEVSLVLNGKVPEGDLSIHSATGGRVSKIIAVIGANASGKTALIKPIPFLSWFVSASFQSSPDEKLPFTPHFATPELPTEFEVEFDADGKLWRYELVANRNMVLHEALYVKRERFNYVFIRDWDAGTEKYKVKQKDFGMSPREASKVRQNASLIATAAQYDIPLAKRMANPMVSSNVHARGRWNMDFSQVTKAASYFSANDIQMKKMNELIANWDFGLSAVRIRKEPAVNNKGEAQEVLRAFGVHLLSGKEIELNLFEESSGTQGAFVLLAKLLPVLERGGVAVIDEFENDLHPHMLEPIIDLFANAETNPHHAQLIFTCHALEVLNLLHKSQVVLVEKDAVCESKAWRLDSMGGVRPDDNLYAKYMSGAYGAVPQL